MMERGGGSTALPTPGDDEYAGFGELFGMSLSETVREAYRIARYLTRDAVDAEDVMQETVIKFWSAYRDGRLKPTTTSPKGRVRVAVAHRVITRRRKESAKRRGGGAHPVALDEAVTDIASTGSTPEDALLDGELREWFASAIASLPQAQREVVGLMCDGLSHSEISEVLDLPLGTVKSRLRAAVALLRRRSRGDEQSGGE